MALLRLKCRTPLVISALAGVVIVALRLGYSLFGPPLLVNYTDSEPKGIYWLEVNTNRRYRRGDTVEFPVPLPFRALVFGRQWLAAGLPLLKGIGAVEGDLVCTDERNLRINGEWAGPVFENDSLSRALPKIRGCYRVPSGYFLPLSDRVARSFDGRYLGPQPLAAIAGEVHSLCTW